MTVCGSQNLGSRYLSDSKTCVFSHYDIAKAGLERSSAGGDGNLLQYSCLENPMHRGAWWATVHRVAKHTHTG